MRIMLAQFVKKLNQSRPREKMPCSVEKNAPAVDASALPSELKLVKKGQKRLHESGFDMALLEGRPEQIEHFVMEMTDRCNLRCVYCHQNMPDLSRSF